MRACLLAIPHPGLQNLITKNGYLMLYQDQNLPIVIVHTYKVHTLIVNKAEHAVQSYAAGKG